MFTIEIKAKRHFVLKITDLKILRDFCAKKVDLFF